MIDKELIYNNEPLIILSSFDKELLKAFEYTYGNVFMLDLFDNINVQVKQIKKSNFNQIIFVDYYPEYDGIISQYYKKKDIKIIFTKSLGAFSNLSIYNSFKGVIRLFEEKKISKVGFIDTNLYLTLKDKINCQAVSLDIERKEYSNSFDSNRVGILNNFSNARHSYYNELSALTFNNYSALIKCDDIVIKNFAKLFNIKYKVSKNSYMENNLVNLYINFTDNNFLDFLDSMDKNVPCIIGNNDFLNDSKLSKYLVVNSDDSIDEISKKIEDVKNNRDKILKDYQEFRKEYSKKCIKEKEEFLGYKNNIYKEKNYELLLSIVVPVYNTEKYLSKCLDSIIKALPNILKRNCEILIINDGSTDNSEEIIKKYEKKYKYIRYIYQKNKGLGNVRNVALKNAKGKYIASIDSDDTINKNFFKEVNKAINKDVDIFICDWLTKTNETKYETSAIEYLIFNSLSKYEGIIYSSIMPSTCNKVFKKDLFDDLSITYLEDKYEDFSTNPFVLLRANKIMYVNKPYYEYYIRSNSIMRSSAGLSMIKVIKEFNNRFKKYEKYCNLDIEKFNFYTISWRMETYIFNQLYDLDKKEKEEMMKYIYDNFYEEALEIFSNKYYLEMVNKLDKKKKEYITKRNKAFKDKKMLNVLNDKDSFKLDASIIYYGDKK